MDFSQGFRASYYATVLDPDTWLENGRIELIGGSVVRQIDGLRQTASLEVTEFEPDIEAWIRVYMDAYQNEDVQHEAIFTGLATVPKKERKEQQIECYSVLKPLADIILPRGWYVQAGTAINDALVKLLLDTPAPVDVRPDVTYLTDHIIAEDDDSELDIVTKLLDAAGWRMYIAGDGTIIIDYLPTSSIVTIGAKEADVVEPNYTTEYDLFNCPNVVRITSGDAIAVARDDDPNSRLSTISRGREIVYVENDVDLSDSEGVAEYAQRVLKEKQEIEQTVSYTRRYIPEVNVTDIININYEAIKGIYKIKRQTINLTYGGATAEETERVNENEYN